MKRPCYDPITHTDCPRRCGGCAVNCPEWAKYVSERDKEYKRRKTIMQAATINFGSSQSRFTKREKARMEDRRRHRK